MVDALPYLVDYPYGCTEQTLNRFLPTVITQKVLLHMGLDLKDIQEKRTNLNAQEIGDDQKRAADWSYSGGYMSRATARVKEPVFDEADAPRHGQGRHQPPGQHAVLRRRLGLVQRLGRAVLAAHHRVRRPRPADRPRQRRGAAARHARARRRVAQALPGRADPAHPQRREEGARRRWKEHADNLDAFVYMVLADEGAKRDNLEMRDFLYRDRNELAVYAKAMFGLALHKLGDIEKRDMLLRNIDQFLVQDDENQTAYLKLPANNWWWCWYGSEYEAQAYYLKLLSRRRAEGREGLAAGRSTSSTTASTPRTGTARATRPSASRRSPITSRPAARTSRT